MSLFQLDQKKKKEKQTRADWSNLQRKVFRKTYGKTFFLKGEKWCISFHNPLKKKWDRKGHKKYSPDQSKLVW